MKAAVVCNGPSSVAFRDSLGYDYTIGCNIPWTRVDSTVILDGNVIHCWAKTPSLIECPAFFTARAWRTADEVKFRDYILETKTVSRTEQILLATMLSSVTLPALEHAKALGMSEREHTEFVQWIQTLTSGE